MKKFPLISLLIDGHNSLFSGSEGKIFEFELTYKIQNRGFSTNKIRKMPDFKTGILNCFTKVLLNETIEYEVNSER